LPPRRKISIPASLANSLSATTSPALDCSVRAPAPVAIKVQSKKDEKKIRNRIRDLGRRLWFKALSADLQLSTRVIDG